MKFQEPTFRVAFNNAASKRDMQDKLCGLLG